LDRNLEGKQLRAATAALVPRERPGDFNQALMEIGATVCAPRAPRCDECPLRAHCVARRNGTQAQRPAAAKKTAAPVIDVGVAVLRDARGRVLLVRRPAKGLLAGMWELPGRAVEAGAAPEDAALGAARAASGAQD